MSKYAINFNNDIIDLKDLSDFGFDEYNELNDILRKESDTKEQYYLLLQLFTGLDSQKIRTIKDPFIVDFKKVLSGSFRTKTVVTKFGGYPFINLDDITIGRFIDLEFFLLNDVDFKLESIVALMLLPFEFEKEDFKSLVDLVHKSFNIGNAIQFFEMFSNYRTNLYSDYAGLFQVQEEVEDTEVELDSEDEPEEQEEIGLGLMEFVYFLANDNFLSVDKILENSLIGVMNYLAWKKSQNDKEIEKQKQDALKHKY
jgi:hypothetical protein